MWIWNWYQSLSVDAKGLLVTLGGLFIKWLLDRRLIANLRRDVAVKEAEINIKQKELNKAKSALEEEQQKLNNLLEALYRNESGLWATHPRRAPFEDYDSRIGRRQPLLLTIANNKGGVGKTTLAANLLAYFSAQKHKRVLAIDLDYQGSLSTMLRSVQGRAQDRVSNVNELLSANADMGTLYNVTSSLGNKLPDCALVTAFYELAVLEDRMMVDWLLQRTPDDPRFRLGRLLLRDEFRGKFDVVIFDLPPRLTMGAINALSASTHILVPTVFNPIAAEPVENFLSATTSLVTHLNPMCKFLGVVETMVPPANERQRPRSEGRRLIQEALNLSFPGLEILDSGINDRTAIARGGLTYLEDSTVRANFDELGDEISRKVGLQ